MQPIKLLTFKAHILKLVVVDILLHSRHLGLIIPKLFSEFLFWCLIHPGLAEIFILNFSYKKKKKNEHSYSNTWGFPGGSDSKESACNAGDLVSIPGLGRSPGEENGNLLQYSCLGNPKDR